MKIFLIILLSITTLYSISQEKIDFHPDNLKQLTLAKFKSNSITDNLIMISDFNKEGLFSLDPTDTTSVNDDIMILVTSNHRRYKRIVQEIINVKWFGALGDGIHDDWHAIQFAVDYVISHRHLPRTLYFPEGTYPISQPLILSSYLKDNYQFFCINLKGATPAKATSSYYSSKIVARFNDKFAIGLQRARTCIIENLAIMGQFSFPNKLTALQICTLKFDEWQDGKSRDNKNSPYAGIVIDPFCESELLDPKNQYPGMNSFYKGTGQGGTSGIQIKECSVKNFIVGIMVTPNPHTANAEISDIIDCNIDYNKVGIAFGQDQTKENHIIRLKCWGGTHTIYDGVHYGKGYSSSPYIDGMNIAGAVNQLIQADISRFPTYIMNVFAEALFRIGSITGNASAHIINCQFNFISIVKGFPTPDYYIYGGNISFEGTMLRLYTENNNFRLKLSNCNSTFVNGVTNCPPLITNIANYGIGYQTPSFENVTTYTSPTSVINPQNKITNTNKLVYNKEVIYPGTTYEWHSAPYFPKYKITYSDNYERLVDLGKSTVHLDKTTWTAYFVLNHQFINRIKINDYIVSNGCWPTQHYYDKSLNDSPDPTIVFGKVTDIINDTIKLDQVSIDALDTNISLNLYADYFVINKGILTGDITKGSNLITNAELQQSNLNVGDRLDIPAFPNGTYVSAIKNDTIVMSDIANVNQPNATIINGNPTIQIYSKDPPDITFQNNNDLYGGADYYVVKDNITLDHYKIINTNIGGKKSLRPLKYYAITSKEGSTDLAVGSSKQRSNYSNTGSIRFNTDKDNFEGFEGKNWKDISWKGEENITIASTVKYIALPEDINIVYTYNGMNGSIILPAASSSDKKVFYINNSSSKELSLICEEKAFHKLAAGKNIKIVANAATNQWYIVSGNE